LRHPKVVSPLEQFERGTFQRVMADIDPARTRIERVLLCSGKLYYDLEAKRQELGRDDVAILRIEQLYPLPKEPLRAELSKYPDDAAAYWVQEEPENMGAWRFLRVQLGERLFNRMALGGICRPASGSPATGSASSHRLE